MDRQTEAQEYLKKAGDADPNGRWSALAKAALGRGGRGEPLSRHDR